MTRALAECEDGVYVVEVGATVEDDALLELRPGETLAPRPRPVEAVPGFVSASLVDVDALGTTVVVVVDRRPPLLVSHDGGRTWSERGGGLPLGRCVALGSTPDDALYGARNRLYVSRDGGLFWRAVAVELPEIRAVAWELE
jgi:hypothetical protein